MSEALADAEKRLAGCRRQAAGRGAGEARASAGCSGRSASSSALVRSSRRARARCARQGLPSCDGGHPGPWLRRTTRRRRRSCRRVPARREPSSTDGRPTGAYLSTAALNLVLVLLELGRIDEAEEWLEEAIAEMNPADVVDAGRELRRAGPARGRSAATTSKASSSRSARSRSPRRPTSSRSTRTRTCELGRVLALAGRRDEAAAALRAGARGRTRQGRDGVARPRSRRYSPSSERQMSR